MTDLELILGEAGAAAEWPPTPDIARVVRERLGPRRAPRRFRMRRPPRRSPACATRCSSSSACAA